MLLKENFNKLDTLRCVASEAIFEPKTSLQVFALVWVLFQAMPFQEHVATMLKSACSQVTAAFFYVWTVKFAQARIFGEDMHVCCMQAMGQRLLDLPDLLHRPRSAWSS